MSEADDKKKLETINRQVMHHADQVHLAMKEAIKPFVDEAWGENPQDGIARMIGLMVGLRAFMGEFAGVEATVLEGISRFGIVDLDAYQEFVERSAKRGLERAEAVSGFTRSLFGPKQDR